MGLHLFYNDILLATFEKILILAFRLLFRKYLHPEVAFICLDFVAKEKDPDR